MHEQGYSSAEVQSAMRTSLLLCSGVWDACESVSGRKKLLRWVLALSLDRVRLYNAQFGKPNGTWTHRMCLLVYLRCNSVPHLVLYSFSSPRSKEPLSARIKPYSWKMQCT